MGGCCAFPWQSQHTQLLASTCVHTSKFIYDITYISSEQLVFKYDWLEAIKMICPIRIILIPGKDITLNLLSHALERRF